MLKKINHIELYVENLLQSSFFYERIFGLFRLQQSKIKNDSKETANAFLIQKDIRLQLSASLQKDNDISKHIAKHGDSVKDIAFVVANVNQIFERAINCGSKIIESPKSLIINGQEIIFAKIGSLGSLIHTIISYSEQETIFFPELYSGETVPHFLNFSSTFKAIDHIAICIEKGTLSKWIDWYSNLFDLLESHEENVDTGKSGMNSKVLKSATGSVKLVFTEPMQQYEKSQIQEFIDYNNGPGIQHIAFATEDISEAVCHIKNMGLSFLKVPSKYYEKCLVDFPDMRDKIIEFQPYNILIDKDEDGYLFQVFTQPIQTRPTTFIEIIQRQGSKGFGNNNINALFRMKEMEQEELGTI
jgi:4-hydroxyphenylpyruvate dioxygenase